MASTEVANTDSVQIELLVLGQCRTGTQSIGSALGQLGYKGIYHMRDVILYPDHADQWRKALEAKYEGQGKRFGREEFDQFLKGYTALTDIPVAIFPEELIKAYPSAKVILSTRDEDKWFVSVRDTIWKGWFVQPPPPGPLLDCLVKLHRHIWNDDFEKYGREYFRKQNEIVRKLIAERPEDFLEYNVQQGWEPLCKFLGKEVPQVEFPRKDSWTEFKKQQSSSAQEGQPTASS